MSYKHVILIAVVLLFIIYVVGKRIIINNGKDELVFIKGAVNRNIIDYYARHKYEKKTKLKKEFEKIIEETMDYYDTKVKYEVIIVKNGLDIVFSNLFNAEKLHFQLR